MSNKNVNCKKCGNDYKVPLTANMISICPQCLTYNYCECEYGFGPITPCYIFVGDKEVAQITGNINYHLDSDELGIHMVLKQKYADLAVCKEATEIVLEKYRNEFK